MSIREKFHIPELYASYENVKSLKIEAANLISWDLTPRQLCDLEFANEWWVLPSKWLFEQNRL